LANSTSDDANFINFCAGKQLTNGLQVTGGSCNGIGKSADVVSPESDLTMGPSDGGHPFK
jgi:transcription initiation factor TFIID subunit 15